MAERPCKLAACTCCNRVTCAVSKLLHDPRNLLLAELARHRVRRSLAGGRVHLGSKRPRHDWPAATWSIDYRSCCMPKHAAAPWRAATGSSGALRAFRHGLACQSGPIAMADGAGGGALHAAARACSPQVRRLARRHNWRKPTLPAAGADRPVCTSCRGPWHK